MANTLYLKSSYSFQPDYFTDRHSYNRINWGDSSSLILINPRSKREVKENAVVFIRAKNEVGTCVYIFIFVPTSTHKHIEITTIITY